MMTIFKHELKQNRTSFLIWTSVISFMIGVCVLIYPEMKGEMDSINEVFSDMGSFTAAFGMDQINFGTLLGYYAVECGNTLGLGGAFFAAICGVSMLAKEEKDRTAEFLLTHPVSRVKIITQKLFANKMAVNWLFYDYVRPKHILYSRLKKVTDIIAAIAILLITLPINSP